MPRSLNLVVLALACTACDGSIYVRDGVTDGDTFYLAERALHDPDPVLQSWVSYSLTKSTCQLQAGAANPARATSFECELKAREHLVETWSELRVDGAAPENRYLDELRQVARAGYLEEYVWEYLGKSSWQAPVDLEAEQFELWRQQVLRRHEPETRLIGSWGYSKPQRSTTPDSSPGTSGIATDGIFRITPLRPVEELKEEALAAKPPHEEGDFREVDLVELTALDPGIKLDVRYATTDNFLSTRLYGEPRAFLQRPAAEALVRAHRAAKEHGYGLLIHDAYRPWWITKVFWEATPEELRDFVADPAEGSRHNRGCAVDLTLYDLETGEAVQMPGLYDEMTERSYTDYTGGTAEQRRRRDLLRRLMEQQGFTVYETEWWHFDYKDWSHYPIVNLTFDELDAGL